MTKRLRTRTLPRDDDDCGWLAPTSAGAPKGASKTSPERPRLQEHVEADTVVVGAGFTGLAAARRAAELAPDGRTVLLDAQRAGFGASGRSSGFVVDIAFFTTAMATEDAERHVALSRSGIETLRRLVAGHGIDCDWDDTGWIHAAAGEAGLADLTLLAAWLDERGEDYRDLDADAMARVTGTRFYRRGLRLPGRPLIQAGALVRGLAAALPEAVELYERSPVLSMEPAGGRAGSGGRWSLETPGGSVTARRVLLATNGFTPSLGALERRIFPLVTFAGLTRRLSAAELGALGGEPEWGVLAQDPMGSSLRRTRDGRLLVRNTLHYHRDLRVGEAVRRRAREAHRRALAGRWPELFAEDGAVELEHSWGGVMGVSPSRRHVFDRIADGVWAAAGFTGAGIALGTAAGELLAEWAAGEESERLRAMRALPGPGKLPPQPFSGWGIGWRVRRMNAAAGETL